MIVIIRKLMFGLIAAVILFTVLDLWGTSYQAKAPLYSNQVAVLMYHHVHDTDESSSTVHSSLFRDQLSYLKSKGYHFITLSEFRAFYEGGAVPDQAVLVTFDDGYRSFYDYAFPVLKELDIPAVNFIVTKETEAPDESPIPTLTAGQIRELLAYRPGMFELQCHSHALHYKIGSQAGLTSYMSENGVTESQDQYSQRIREDSKACAAKLNELYGVPQAALNYAYPFGIFSPAAKTYIQEAGFRYGFTIVSEMATRRSNPMEIPRINAGNPKIKPEHLDQLIRLRVQRGS